MYETVSESIAAADAVIAVLDRQSLQDVAFRLGLAVGSKRPVLLIAGETLDRFRTDSILAALPRFQGKLTDEQALRFHVAAFLEGVEKDVGRPKAAGRAPALPRGSSHHFQMPDSMLERHLYEAFQLATEIGAIQHAPPILNDRSFRPDFAIWMDNDHGTIVNPIVVEVAAIGPAFSLERKIGQIRKYATEGGIGTAMLVVDGATASLDVRATDPLTIVVGLEALVELLAKGELWRAISVARNSAAEGGR
ncbi:hypothetical protein [Rhizobium tubonense]|uniref:Uncharacterized protein n=1 Tax=Rhizobium tubonense TaxID=484088 RepID=A0A2W4CLM7_9HYPH|nr:hypothetical protein [Rhizobium tubonense]PZM13719.1 hypothetical protein CPY51_12600 [Rhizobium tubonense]